MKKILLFALLAFAAESVIAQFSVRLVVTEVATKKNDDIYLSGTFNNWNPTANPLNDNPGSGHCKAFVQVPPGSHEYKFVVDGTWTADPKCENWTSNSHGSLNSVIHV